jgi:hypothetical protein
MAAVMGRSVAMVLGLFWRGAERPAGRVVECLKAGVAGDLKLGREDHEEQLRVPPAESSGSSSSARIASASSLACRIRKGPPGEGGATGV